MGGVCPARFLRFGSFQLDVRSGELRRNGVKVRVPDQSIQVLGMLLDHPGEVVTREELQQKLWPNGTIVEFDHGINAAIKRLRQALEDSAEEPRFIETLPRRGYRFIDRVNELGLQPAVEIAAFPPSQLSVAVLPFANLSPDKDQEYFCDGLTEEILHALTNVAGLEVIAHSSALQFKDRAYDAREIGRKLNVFHIIEGTVRVAGNNLRITVQLVNVSSGHQIWSGAYDHELKNVFKIQQQIAVSVAEALRSELVGSEPTAISRCGTTDVTAYQAYLRGRFHWAKRTEDGLQKSIEHFRDALRRDTRFARAEVGLADCYIRLSGWDLAPPLETMPTARLHVNRALQIDPTLGEAYVSVGAIHLVYDYNRVAAGQDYKRAIELSPGYVVAHWWYGCYLEGIGQTVDALTELKRAERLDPLSAAIGTDIADILYNRGECEQAVRYCRKVLEIDPHAVLAYQLLGESLLSSGKDAEAFDALEMARTLYPTYPRTLAKLGWAHAIMSRYAEADRILREMQHLSRTRYVPAFEIARVYIGLRNWDSAFNYLQKAFEERSPQLAWTRRLRLFDDLRVDPRFDRFVARISGPE